MINTIIIIGGHPRTNVSWAGESRQPVQMRRHASTQICEPAKCRRQQLRTVHGQTARDVLVLVALCHSLPPLLAASDPHYEILKPTHNHGTDSLGYRSDANRL
jgi:hypothetical protein